MIYIFNQNDVQILKQHHHQIFHLIVAMEQQYHNHLFGKKLLLLIKNNIVFFIYYSNFIRDCANGRDEEQCADCTFEQDTCRWLDVSDGAFVWQRDQGMNAGPLHSGPVVDRKFYSYSILIQNNSK